jgi:hypothetical protein
VDAFTIVVFVGLAVVIGFVFLLGRANQNAPMNQFGLRSAQEITESKEALDAEDLDQMMEAANARRRARGERERTVEDVELQVMHERNEMIRHREAVMAEQELDELLEATNARRRARGLPERTREDVQREFGGSQ